MHSRSLQRQHGMKKQIKSSPGSRQRCIFFGSGSKGEERFLFETVLVRTTPADAAIMAAAAATGSGAAVYNLGVIKMLKMTNSEGRI